LARCTNMALGLVGRRHPLVVVSPQDAKFFEIWTLRDSVTPTP
jgi:hypothetical protein